jgi:hypothetical protein
MWAIRPHNPLFLSDGAISSSIEQMLTNNGPMTLEGLVTASQLNGADINLFERFLNEHPTEFTLAADGTYWFTDQPRPIRRDFESICHALVYALSCFPEGGSVEELSWFLCLATVDNSKLITRRCVSRELSRRVDLFQNLSRARYRLIEGDAGMQLDDPRRSPEMLPPPPPPAGVFRIEVNPPAAPQIPNPVFHRPAAADPSEGGDFPQRPTEEDVFDPFNFFNRDFPFAFD